jgi:hypothetical protein
VHDAIEAPLFSWLPAKDRDARSDYIKIKTNNGWRLSFRMVKMILQTKITHPASVFSQKRRL